MPGRYRSRCSAFALCTSVGATLKTPTWYSALRGTSPGRAPRRSRPARGSRSRRPTPSASAARGGRRARSSLPHHRRNSTSSAWLTPRCRSRQSFGTCVAHQSRTPARRSSRLPPGSNTSRRLTCQRTVTSERRVEDRREGMQMPGACAGIRVLDCSRGAAGHWRRWCSPTSAPRSCASSRPGATPSTTMPAYLLAATREEERHDRPRRRRPAGRELRRLVPGFDVVVEDWGPGRADDAGIGYAELSSINPALVGCSITGFGNTGPFAHVAADDALVMAKAGIFRDQPGWERDGKRPDLPLVPRRLVLRRDARGAGNPRGAARRAS